MARTNTVIGGGSLALEVNGTPNVDQSLLNLIAGTGITVVDNGAGGVTITATGATSPGGANTNVQYNDSGVFGGDVNFTWDKVNKILKVYQNASGSKLSLFLDPTTTHLFGIGDINTAHNGTRLIIDDATKFSGMNMNPASFDAAWTVKNLATPTIEPIQFLGTGLDDALDGGTYSAITSALISVVIIAVDITITDPTGWAAFQTITDTTSGVTGIVQSVVGSVLHINYSTPGIFNPGDSITNGTQTTTVVSSDQDYFVWREGIQAGFTTAIDLSAQPIGQLGTVTIGFGAINGHTGMDEWDIAVIANYIYTGWSSDGTERFWLQDDGRMALVNTANRNLLTIDPNINFYEFGNTFDPGFMKMDGSSGSAVWTFGSGANNFLFMDVANLSFQFGDIPQRRQLLIDGTADTFFLGDATRWGISMDAAFLNLKVARVGEGNYLLVDRATQAYGIGDLDAVSNGIRFLADNNGMDAFMGRAAGLDFRVSNNLPLFASLSTGGGLARYFIADITDGLYVFGDYDNSLNGTKFVMDDTAQTITAISSVSFVYQRVDGKQLLSLDSVAGIYSMGDLGVIGNGTRFVADDSISTLFLKSKGGTQAVDITGNRFLDLNFQTKQFAIGDLDATNNGTSIVVDDPIQDFRINGSLSLAKQESAPANAGTVSIAKGISLVVLNPATTLTAITLNFPSTPNDGMELVVTGTQVIATITLANGNWTGGSTTSMAPGIKRVFYWSAVQNLWI